MRIAIRIVAFALVAAIAPSALAQSQITCHWGKPSAPVRMDIFSDYQCPACRAFYMETMKLMFKDYADTGKVCVVYRHFPLSRIHPHAEHAAEIAEAAGEHGKFWEMHDLLFENQEALEDDQLIVYAETLDIDPAWAREALAERRFEPRVRADFASGVRSGVNGTPTFFINGVRYDGGADTLLDALMEATIDAPLKSGG